MVTLGVSIYIHYRSNFPVNVPSKISPLSTRSGNSRETTGTFNLTPIVFQRSEHSVSRSNIDPDALKILHRLNHQGFTAYLVGGGVRDLLLGKTPKDFDIATDATPNQIKKLFRNCRIIGRRFKLAHIFYPGGKTIQVATFRAAQDAIPEEPSEGDGASITLQDDNNFGTPASDALRRDLSINGLFYCVRDFTVIDYVGGMEDLSNKVIRVIGDPAVRFAEDPVRIIRSVRHAVRAGFTIEQGCANAILEHHTLLAKVPGVRIFEELKKDLFSGNCLEILLSLRTYKILEDIFPSLAVRPGPLDREETRKALSTLDTFVRGGQIISQATAFAVLAAGALHPDPEVPIVFSDRALDAEEAIKKTFQGVQVPRRDVDTAAFFHSWWARLASPQSKVKPQQLARFSHIDEFNTFATIMTLAGFPGAVLERLGEALALRARQGKKKH
jgi:poly(A) polymerase